MSKPDFTNSLTEQERVDLITTIKVTMQIVVDNSLLEEQGKTKFFDLFEPFYPKNGPMSAFFMSKKELLKVTLRNSSKDKIIWNRGSIGFDYNSFDINELRTLFVPDDFDKLLDLTFEKVNKEIVEYEGKEVGSYYLYTYHWKLNNKLKVMFKVNDNLYIKEDNYPRDFFMIDIVLDN